ncbi:hypothetical protein FA13DRAFT_1795883 [Coprinellus micaceus]|uniref:Uncharacterized protein n=1 Tax=Coprinellus micaceus TaxID=71717 RepID=A0A4Y7SWR2_COPMI|nr:hypothetical protein FA13DRAFT_1795883 [Coprinellus micaceus]
MLATSDTDTLLGYGTTGTTLNGTWGEKPTQRLVAPISEMEDPSPFQQYLGTNYIPTSQEIDTIKALIEERKGAIYSIDAEISELMRKRKTLVLQSRARRLKARV